MLKKLFIILTATLIFVLTSKNAYAIVDPLSAPNNKFGVHILFTSELSNAAGLVNSSMGDWGYVTIPIQASDKDLEKWQKFMDDCGKFHLIPIIRIATENYHFETSLWRKPTREDILDFANFLNSLQWPVKNRYVVVFNEVNRADEWEGAPNPEEYAVILDYAVNTFKSIHEDFFIISGGFDNASANISGKSMNQYDFMIAMNNAVPGIFAKIDGLGSHSYPNPAFSQPPSSTTNMSISSFKFEKNLAFELSGRNLPVFITETGWSDKKLPEGLIASYFTYAFESVWSDSGIVAVTPFILQAGTEPFLQFSLSDDRGYNEIGTSLQKIAKTKGNPIVNVNSSSSFSPDNSQSPLKVFPQKPQYENPSIDKDKIFTPFLRWLLKIPN